MNRLCITINFFPITGGARAIVADVWRTTHNQYEIHFLTIPPEGYSDQYLIHPLQRMRRHVVPLNPGLFPLCFLYVFLGILKLLQLNRAYRFTAILAQDGVFTGLYSTIVGKLTHTKVVIMDYGPTTNFLSNSYWNFEKAIGNKALRALIKLHTLLLRSSARLAIRLTAKMATKFAVLGYELKAIYRQINIPDSKMMPIQYGTDETFFQPSDAETRMARRIALGIDPNSIVVNATNRISQDKGIEYMLPAMKTAVEKNDRIIFLLVGAGNMFNFAYNFIKQHGLENKIRLMGEVPPSKVRDLLQISDIFVYASVSSSNIALTVLEAMATQVAVVATDAPNSHRDLLADKRGIVVPTMNAESIAEAVILLAGDDRLRRNLAENGRKFVLKNHSSEAYKRSIELLVKT